MIEYLAFAKWSWPQSPGLSLALFKKISLFTFRSPSVDLKTGLPKGANSLYGLYKKHPTYLCECHKHKRQWYRLLILTTCSLWRWPRDASWNSYVCTFRPSLNRRCCHRQSWGHRWSHCLNLLQFCPAGKWPDSSEVLDGYRRSFPCVLIREKVREKSRGDSFSPWSSFSTNAQWMSFSTETQPRVPIRLPPSDRPFFPQGIALTPVGALAAPFALAWADAIGEHWTVHSILPPAFYSVRTFSVIQAFSFLPSYHRKFISSVQDKRSISQVSRMFTHVKTFSMYSM